MRNKKKRSKMSNQMMVVLSTFDLFGSVAYSLTSLPMSVEDGVYGSKGNDASCTAQGFFIQVNCICHFQLYQTAHTYSTVYFSWLLRFTHFVQLGTSEWIWRVQLVNSTSLSNSISHFSNAPPSRCVHKCFSFHLLLAHNQVQVVRR